MNLELSKTKILQELLSLILLCLMVLYFSWRRRMNRELRCDECKAYIREVNLNAREGRINAEYCLRVCDWRLCTHLRGISPGTLRHSFSNDVKVEGFMTAAS